VAAGGTLYDTAGVGRLGALAGALVFWRAILAKASRMDEPFCGTGAGAAGSLPCMEASKPGGGLPGGVVEASVRARVSIIYDVMCMSVF
jgi:hypothetical protein